MKESGRKINEKFSIRFLYSVLEAATAERKI
jgi:hypothetical protein